MVCQCSEGASAGGLVFGDVFYTTDSNVCRSAIHAGALTGAGGLIAVHLLPVEAAINGSDRNGVLSQAGKIVGIGYRPVRITRGTLEWTARLSVALSEQNQALQVPGTVGSAVPALPTQAGYSNDFVPRNPLTQQPNLDGLSPPVLMPAFWRTPVLRQETAAEKPVSTLAPAIRGVAKVITSSQITVGNKTVNLAFIQGVSGPQARGMAAFIAGNGGILSCTPLAPGAATMQCMTEAGVDVAETALFNGGARASTDAPENYRNAEAAARLAKRGLWSTQQ